MQLQIEKPENENLKFEQTGLAKPIKTCVLTGMCTGLPCQDAVGRVLGWVWD
jgi:hypothetical protein